MTDHIEILTGLGYVLKDFGDHYRTKPLYRESDNFTSLAIDKKRFSWKDYSVGKFGTFEELVQLTMGLASLDEAKTFLTEKYSWTPTAYVSTPKIKQIKKLNPEDYENLIKDYSYWRSRGIPDEVISQFEGGVATTGKMKNRYVFIVRDKNDKIVGVTGRDLTGKSSIKWKHLSNKQEWNYPIKLGKPYKDIVLVESVGCMLSLYNAGITNCLVLFGTQCSLSILNFLLRASPERIIIATNNEPENANIGNEAAKVIKNKLKRYFDLEQLEIRLPTRKDFSEMTKEEVLKWYAQ